MKTMNKLIIAIPFILSACADFSTSPTFKWRPYLDIDNSIQYMDFMERVISDDEKGKLQISYGSAIKKTKFGDLDTYATIGDFYPLVDENKYAMGAIFLVDKKSLNPYVEQDAKILVSTKELDFYDFGKGRIGHAKFVANNKLCADFKSARGVKISIATTYYEDYENYYASQISAVLNTKGISNLKYEPYFSFTNKKIEQEHRKKESQMGKDVAERNLKERIALLHFICK
ncbi:hypothetical protein GVX76_03650 [[Haemophilus] felis]|nr:hypothetical protein [[Haemophilus] felis]